MAGILFLSLALLSAPAPFSLLFALILHEGAHICTAALLGFKAPQINFTPGGIRLSFGMSKSRTKALAVLISGCLAGASASILPFFSRYFRLYCAGLSIMNLLPVSCLDGGEILLTLLEALMLPDRAYRTVSFVSNITVIGLFVLSLAVQLKAGANLSLLAVSLYLIVSTLADKKT